VSVPWDACLVTPTPLTDQLQLTVPKPSACMVARLVMLATLVVGWPCAVTTPSA